MPFLTPVYSSARFMGQEQEFGQKNISPPIPDSLVVERPALDRKSWVRILVWEPKIVNIGNNRYIFSVVLQHATNQHEQADVRMPLENHLTLLPRSGGFLFGGNMALVTAKDPKVVAQVLKHIASKLENCEFDMGHWSFSLYDPIGDGRQDKAELNIEFLFTHDEQRQKLLAEMEDK